MIKNCKQIQLINADYGMCGQIRINWPAEVLKNGSNLQIHNSRNFIPSLPSDCVIIQRCLDKKFNDIVKPVSYKKVADFDDMPFSISKLLERNPRAALLSIPCQCLTTFLLNSLSIRSTFQLF